MTHEQMAEVLRLADEYAMTEVHYATRIYSIDVEDHRLARESADLSRRALVQHLECLVIMDDTTSQSSFTKEEAEARLRKRLGVLNPNNPEIGFW